MKNLIELIEIPAGSFLMGSPETEAGRYSDEGPRHLVTVSAFKMGKYPVTQAQWRAVMGDNPSYFKGDGLPVTNISWHDFGEFCRKLSDATGDNYRRPSEAEWEYACRAGSATAYCFGDDPSLFGEYAWFSENSNDRPHPVGQKKPNAWGLYDMHGNVWEWCEDAWHDDYKGAPTDGGAWTGKFSGRVLRGGSYFDDAVDCRSACRDWYDARFFYHDVGVRVVVSARTS